MFIDPFQLDRSAGTAQGLVGLWGPGPSGGGTLYDMSGRGNDGTLTNGPTWRVDSDRDWYLNFDRASSQEVVIPNHRSLFSMPQLSLTVWARSNGTHSSGDEYNLIDAWATGDTNYLLRGDNTNQVEFYTDTSSGVIGGGFTDMLIDDSIWHFIAATYDGSTMRLYVDGVPSATTYAQTGTIDAGSTNISIGGRLATTLDYWHGDIAGARIYNRNLSTAEVQHIYQKTLGGFPSDIQMQPRRVFKAAAAAGLSIPIAMYHYKQMMGV